MAATLTGGTFSASTFFQGTGVYAPGGTLQSKTLTESKSAALSFTYGTTSGKIDAWGCVERTLAGGASDTLDLSTGGFGSGNPVKDPFGQTVALATIKYIRVEVVSGTGSGLTVGNAAADANQLWLGGDTHTAGVTNGGVPFEQGDAAGKTVDGTNKNVKILNADGANSLVYRVTVAGVSA